MFFLRSNVSASTLTSPPPSPTRARACARRLADTERRMKWRGCGLMRRKRGRDGASNRGDKSPIVDHLHPLGCNTPADTLHGKRALTSKVNARTRCEGGVCFRPCPSHCTRGVQRMPFIHVPYSSLFFVSRGEEEGRRRGRGASFPSRPLIHKKKSNDNNIYIYIYWLDRTLDAHNCVCVCVSVWVCDSVGGAGGGGGGHAYGRLLGASPV